MSILILVACMNSNRT